MTIRVAITGLGLEAPVLAHTTGIESLLDRSAEYGWDFDPSRKLGKKGLRYKEVATLMSLCAARGALEDSGHLAAGADGKLNDERFGVAIGSNSSNLDTICQVAERIRSEHVDATSPMDLPNASSNVVASTLAIRHGLRALNLMLTSGANASFDALALAANAITAGRVERMLVGAVEVDSLALNSLQAGRRLDPEQASPVPAVMPVASAVVLENAELAARRGVRIYGYLDDYAMNGASTQAAQRFARFVMGRHHELYCLDAAQLGATLRGFSVADLGADANIVDLSARTGQWYGGLALAQLMLACERFATGRAANAMLVSGATLGDRRLSALALSKA
ncbi:beta-ketoacyl synthase N-terminal-like domain-containing protein [Janthinobacterium fluminis]|uniref:Beta-ketoacyl synthase N-terminal-like domain-containing protein n=1 Tax=Janthinobacterium fluminis TaxID=2987524 RepID=A0ABT5K1T9_9BURK|nr:beta-ketoacyl synthase N-terminal-like domain-containing protein [Janthinobacterium fluminis]MDC8758947.1 beta-ketoacyl synthase N-terminal-like domain-containing protein [Janthinobacterium fluminis]